LLDSFPARPWGGLPIVATAERVAAEAHEAGKSSTRSPCLRYQHYHAALLSDRAFQRAYMVPVTLADPARRAVVIEETSASTHSAEGLAKPPRPHPQNYPPHTPHPAPPSPPQNPPKFYQTRSMEHTPPPNEQTRTSRTDAPPRRRHV